MCDNERYTREKNTYQTVKRYGLKVNSSRYIQDGSLIHRKGTNIPVEGTEEETTVDDGDTTANMSKTQVDALKNQTMDDIKNMVANNDSYIAS